MIKLTYDGQGLNDCNDPYKTRVLTFSKTVSDNDRQKIAALLTAAPDLMEALQAVLSLDIKGHSLLDRLQFSTTGRALSEQCLAALKKAQAETIER